MGDDNNPAVGYYINFLSVPGLLLVPTFGFDSEHYTVRFLSEIFQNKKAVAIPCFDVAMCGGCISCVTWSN